MGINDIINVVISSNSRGITQASFGTVMVLGYQTNDMNTYKSYDASTVLSSLVTDGYTAYDPIYRACQKVVSATPKTKRVVVGRLTTAFDQTFELTVLALGAEVGRTISFTMVSPDGTETAISYVVQSGDTTTLVAVALAALMDAVTDITVTSAVAVISAAADNSGEMFYIKDLDVNVLSYEDTTADSSLATEYAAITSVYGDHYGIILADPNSKARVTALAAVAETESRMFGYTTQDSAVGDSTSTTDVFYTLNAASYYRTFGIYSGDGTSYSAAAWMGKLFPINPGKSTWAYKALSGVTYDDLTSDFTDAIAAKKGNYYVSIKSAAATYWGTMAAGEYIDVIRGRDWFTARMQDRIFGRFINSDKVPYTQKGAESIGSDVDAQIKEGKSPAYGYFDAAQEHTVTVPDVTDASQVSAANKTARTLPNVSAEAYLAGAIHIVDPLNVVIST